MSTRATTPAAAELAARMCTADFASAWDLVQQQLDAGIDPRQIYLELLLPALSGIGNGWHDSAHTVAEEHLATSIATRIVARLSPRFVASTAAHGSVLLGCIEGDQHALAVMVAADLVRAAGFDVYDLGGDTPTAAFVACAEGLDDLCAIGICVTCDHLVGAARAVVVALRSVLPAEVGVLVGGQAIRSTDDAVALGADGGGPDVTGLLSWLTAHTATPTTVVT